VWHQQAAETDALRGWLAGLPGSVERGDVPTQAQADAWARRTTQGMIETFPIEITPLVVLVLASALATKVSWLRPFDVVPATALGDSPWATALQRVLRSPESGHDCYIAETERAGRVAVHTARDEAGRALIALLPTGDWEYDARQSAYARYSREGFEAAAVTALGVRLAAARPGDGVRRTATLRFGHPYAVVAAVESDESPWDGLPVFSAWVAEPENAEADSPGPRPPISRRAARRGCADRAPLRPAAARYRSSRWARLSR
jgi:hypothetical protein